MRKFRKIILVKVIARLTLQHQLQDFRGCPWWSKDSRHSNEKLWSWGWTCTKVIRRCRRNDLIRGVNMKLMHQIPETKRKCQQLLKARSTKANLHSAPYLGWRWEWGFRVCASCGRVSSMRSRAAMYWRPTTTNSPRLWLANDCKAFLWKYERWDYSRFKPCYGLPVILAKNLCRSDEFGDGEVLIERTWRE